MDAAQRRIRRGLICAVVAIGVLAGIGTVLLWPRGDAPDLGAQPNRYVDATVTAVEPTTCTAIEVAAPTACQLSTVRITSGSEAGASGLLVTRDIDFDTPRLAVGDRIVVLDVATSPAPYRYTFADFQRSSSMWLLVALFAVVVVAFGRWQGVRALIGLALSGLVLVAFIVPAVLRDEPAVLVALTGTVLIAFLALYLAHGVNIATTVALVGTLASLGLTVLLALAAVAMTHLTGLADEQAQTLRVTAAALDLRGLLIAGIVVGALGVLDDVTVTQVSTVAVLRRARPDASRRAIYRDALAVGRDHVASTVNTLVLAYAGAALPLLLLFDQGAKPVGRILTSEVVAVEVVRMLVGSIGLVLSVPITTALAAAVIGRHDAAAHGHGHGHDFGPVRAGAVQHEEADGPQWSDFGPRHLGPADLS